MLVYTTCLGSLTAHSHANSVNLLVAMTHSFTGVTVMTDSQSCSSLHGITVVWLAQLLGVGRPEGQSIACSGHQHPSGVPLKCGWHTSMTSQHVHQLTCPSAPDAHALVSTT